MVASDLCEIWVNLAVIESSGRSWVKVDDHESNCTVHVFLTGRSLGVKEGGHVPNSANKGSPRKTVLKQT